MADYNMAVILSFFTRVRISRFTSGVRGSP